jgi:xylulokinase
VTEVTVGLDIGTTSVKALAVDGDGRVVARSRVPHDVHSPSADVYEHDANAAWRLGPRRAVAELGLSGFRGIAVASLLPSLTAVDADGVPISPGLLYGDHRGRTEHSGVDPVAAGESRAMLEWTVRHAPGAHGYWPAPAVAGVALGGAPALDLGGGVALHPLWDGDWQADRLAQFGLRPEQMPLIATAADEPAAHIGDAAQAPSMADAWAEATVAGADEPGDALVICGTSLIVWATIAEPRQLPGLWLIPHPRGGKLVIGGASNAGGMFLNWARRALAGAPVLLEPDNVPVWIPYVRGERSPLHDASRRAALHRLDISHGAPALLRAAYEASGFVTRRMLELGAPETRRIVASGGGVHDDEWIQALADCTGRPVDVVAVPEGAALGAAWYARMAAGLETSVEDAGRWVRHERRVEPDPRWEKPCQERYEEWLTLAG